MRNCFMLLNELEKEYFVLAPVMFDEKNIVICSNKKDASFKYFETKDNVCCDVDLETKSKLDAMFARPSTKFRYIFENNNTQQNSQATYYQIVAECIENIKDEIKFLDEEHQKKILDNLCNVGVLEMRDLPSQYKSIVPQNAIALYAPGINTIILPNHTENTPVDKLRYYTQHELLHCASNYNLDPQINGFLDLTASTETVTPIVISQIMINEIFTEIVNNKIFDKHYNGRPNKISVSYDLCRLVTKPLFDEMNYESAKMAYFMNNSDVFVQYLMGKFHIFNAEVFYKLFSQLDACNLLNINLSFENLYTPANISLYYQCLQECCKSVMDIVINKYVCENKPLNKLTIDYFLPHDNLYNNLPPYSLLRNSKTLKEYLESAKLCIKHLRSCSELDFENSVDDHKAIMLTIVSHIFARKPLPDQDIFEKAKSAELYLSMITNKCFLFDCDKDVVSPMDMKNAIAFIMNPKNNYLPKNKGKAAKLVEKMLIAKNSYDFDIVEYIPKEYFVEACNLNNELFRSFIPKYLGIFINNVEKLNDKNLTDKRFFNALVYIAKSAKPEGALKYMYRYYKSISPEVRTSESFQNNFNNALLVDICNNKKTELYNQIESVIKKDCETYQQKSKDL